MLIMPTISELHKLDRPRERLSRLGPEALLDQELVAVMLGRGVKGKEVMELSNEILEVLDQSPRDEISARLCKIQGIGSARAGQILASLEFARRRFRPEGRKIGKAGDLVPLISFYAGKPQEHFISITLNGANEVMNVRCVSVGLVNCTQVHPREVFADAISDRACSIIVAHNHPSGELKPSDADIAVTKRLIEAGKILGVPVLDHIILSEKRGFSSLRDEGVVWF